MFYPAFASEISFYLKSDDYLGDKEDRINFGTSGSFGINDETQVWRFRHVGIVLDKWTTIFSILHKYRDEYAVLFKS